MPTNAECVHGLLLAFALLVTAHWTVELLYLTPPAREVHGGDPHHHHLLHRPGHSIHRPSASSAEFLARTTHNHSLAAQWLRYYTARPHVAGTPVDREQAAWTAERWREFGWPDVRIETYHPLLNYPRAQGQRVAIVAPPSKRHECTLKEEPVDGDDASRRYRDAVPAFHGYSADGNVTGRLIYVNYGRPADFAMLHARGVDFRGSIALVRYGRQFRGLKVRAAEQYGCAGVLVFSDPADDGYARGKTYPDGPWRPASSLQRGSVHYTSLEPGDPSTPGYPAHRNATRVPQADAKSLPKIPSLPLSYRDAQPLLQALVGHGENVTADAEWRGALDIEYWTGPGDVEVNLVNRVDYRITPIWNVLAKVEGTDPHEQVGMVCVCCLGAHVTLITRIALAIHI